MRIIGGAVLLLVAGVVVLSFVRLGLARGERRRVARPHRGERTVAVQRRIAGVRRLVPVVRAAATDEALWKTRHCRSEDESLSHDEGRPEMGRVKGPVTCRFGERRTGDTNDNPGNKHHVAGGGGTRLAGVGPVGRMAGTTLF
jgi:hypothetical protein